MFTIVKMPYFEQVLTGEGPLLSLEALLSDPQTSRCNSDPSSPLPFLRFLGDKSKDHMQTGNDRLALGLLQREKPTLPQLNLF